MSDKFTFGSAGLIHELEMGMDRAKDWDPALVKLLASGNHLVHVREYLRGRAKIVSIQIEEAPAKIFLFPKNEKGHHIVTFTGLNLTSAEEIARLESLVFRIGDTAQSMLLSTSPDSYDANHRLEDGKVYRVALVPGREVKSKRTTANLQVYGQQFGYGKPLAGIMPRICEAVSGKQMEEMGIWYITALHEPIKDSEGNPSVLGSSGNAVRQWLRNYWGYPGDEWSEDGAFAFVVPQ